MARLGLASQVSWRFIDDALDTAVMRQAVKGRSTTPSGGLMVSAVPILSWLAALVFAAIAVTRGPRPITGRFAADRLLRYLMLFPVGLMGLWAAVGHLLFPAESAQAIGWATSPFQSEVGSANLGLGLAGLYAAFRSFEARLVF
jgi:Family of unknown function (DUF6790)